MDMLSGHLIPVKSFTNHYVHKCGATKTLFDLKKYPQHKKEHLEIFQIAAELLCGKYDQLLNPLSVVVNISF